jgi:hypothetical protein
LPERGVSCITEEEIKKSASDFVFDAGFLAKNKQYANNDLQNMR